MDRQLDFIDYLMAQLEELLNKKAPIAIDEWNQLSDALESWIEAMKKS